MELVPPNSKKWLSTLVPPKATRRAKNNQSQRIFTLSEWCSAALFKHYYTIFLVFIQLQNMWIRSFRAFSPQKLHHLQRRRLEPFLSSSSRLFSPCRYKPSLGLHGKMVCAFADRAQCLSAGTCWGACSKTSLRQEEEHCRVPMYGPATWLIRMKQHNSKINMIFRKIKRKDWVITFEHIPQRSAPDQLQAISSPPKMCAGAQSIP